MSVAELYSPVGTEPAAGAAGDGAALAHHPHLDGPRLLEDALLCCALGGAPSASRRRLVDELVRADLDWDYLVRAAVDHALGPLVFRSLIAELGAQCPDSVAHRLRTLHKLNTARNRWAFEECTALLRALNERGVQAILLKGIAVARFAYADPATRVMGDIDVLVRADDIPGAEQALHDLGCRPIRRGPSPNHHLVPHVTPRSFKIEVHWDLVAHPNAFCIDHDRLWDAARRVRFGDVQTAILSPADLVWHAAVHDAFQHGFLRALQCVADIAAITGQFHSELSEEGMRARAESFGVLDHVQAVLELGAQLLGRGFWAEQTRRPLSPAVRRLAAHGENARRAQGWLGKAAVWFFPSLDVSPHADFATVDIRRLVLLGEGLSALDASRQPRCVALSEGA